MSKIDIKPPKGTRDLFGQDGIIFQKIIDKIRIVFEKYGFEPLYTPAFEDFKLFTIKGGLGEGIKEEIYYFKDKSDRELGLRFDHTMPLVRFIANNPNIPKPYKRYVIAPVWRYDNPQAYRYREFWQADIDIIGSQSCIADAECLACASEALESLGIKNFSIRLNNRKTVEAIVRSYVSNEKIPLLLRILDKIDKIGVKGVKEELKKNGIDERVLDALKFEGDYKDLIVQLKKITTEGLDELEELYNFCEYYGISDKLKLDLFLVRGLDYYTSLVFEIDLGKKVSFGGGGRYDNLVGTISNENLPATGISLGLSRIFDYIKENNLFKEKEKKIFVVYFPQVEREAIEICKKIRNESLTTDINLVDRRIDKQLEYADKKGFDYVIIVGVEEVRMNKVRVKDMRKNSEILVDRDKIDVFMKELISKD